MKAILHTSAGDITVELFPNHAPNTVNNFVTLAKGEREWVDPATGQKTSRPLYDGTIFHRVIPGFMIQGGDPPGTGKEPSDLPSRGIVCGAHNFDVGDYVVVCLPGAVLALSVGGARRSTAGVSHEVFPYLSP